VRSRLRRRDTSCILAVTLPQSCTYNRTEAECSKEKLTNHHTYPTFLLFFNSRVLKDAHLPHAQIRRRLRRRRYVVSASALRQGAQHYPLQLPRVLHGARKRVSLAGVREQRG